MVVRGEIVRYLYWSNRRIRSIADENEIDIDPRWKLKISGFRFPFMPTIDLENAPRTLYHNEIATRIESAIGEHAIEDFVTPPRARFAKGVGRVEFSRFVTDRPDQVVLHTRTQASDGTRVAVCLFGSRDNVAGFLGPRDRQPDGWTSSASLAVAHWLATRCAENNSQWDDPESISVEALNIATYQGTNEVFDENPEQPWTRGFTFADADESEWFVEVYSDVVLTDGRWHLDDPVDRILIGAPLWIRAPRTSVRRYRDYRRRFNSKDFLQVSHYDQ